MPSQHSMMRGPGRNSLITVTFTNESPTSLRDWIFPLFPKGKKSVTTSIQTASGWVTIAPDPNRGMFAEHNTALANRMGAWLRGPISERSCTNDVRLALALLGHRPWDVSTWRVWLYRVFAGIALGSLVYSVAPMLALLAAALPFAVRSPCTPKGLKMWVESKGFLPPALQHEKPNEDDAINVLQRMKEHAEVQA